jgi:hypothetical protein
MSETGKFPEPKIAIDFLSKKVNVPTGRWDDLKWGEHAHALTVAHSVEANILDDIHGLLNKAAAEGISFNDFRNGMLDMMKAKGWYGGAGHTADEKKYINWRIGVIYDTNMRTAYSAEHYRKQLEGAELRPIWVYQSQLTGDNRRKEHIALHGKELRFDDAFWDTYYPPNGWGCECYVITESEHGAEKAGIKVETSEGMALPEIDKTWAYNPGREALAPNFSKYKNLPVDAFRAIKERYRSDMDKTRLSFGQMKKINDAMNAGDYQFKRRRAINYQAGNLGKKPFEATGLDDSKVMINEERIRHAFRQKGDATIPEDCMADAYQALQEPDFIYEEKKARHGERALIFHFVKKTKNQKIINAVLEKKTGFSLRVRTIDLGEMASLNTSDLTEVYRAK